MLNSIILTARQNKKEGIIMKKIIVILLACVFALGAAFGAFAQSLGFTQEQFEKLLGGDALEPTFEHLFFTGNAFYSLEEGGKIYKWNIDEDNISLLCSIDFLSQNINYELLPPEEKEEAGKAVTHIFEGENELWAYNIFSGSYGTIDETGVNWKAQSEDESFSSFEAGNIQGGFAEKGALYFAYNDSLHKIFTDKNEHEEFSFPKYIIKLIPYKENSAIILCYGNTGYDFHKIDLLTGKTELLKLSIPEENIMVLSLEYIKESDRLFLMALDTGQTINVYDSVNGEDFVFKGNLFEQERIVNLSESKYALIKPGGIEIKNTEDMFKTDKQILTVRGMMGFPSAKENFMRENPDVIVREQYTNFSQEDFVKIISGSSDVDIYSMFANRLFKAVKEKGYAASLDSSETLNGFFDRLYPIFQDTIKDKNGSIIAWPDFITLYNVMTINEKLWQDCFSGRPYPETFAELFNAMAEWENDFAEQYDSAIVYSPEPMHSLLNQMVFKYCSMYETKENPVDFDTASFRDSLKAYRSMIDCINAERLNSRLENEDELNPLTPLFQSFGLSTSNFSLFNPQSPGEGSMRLAPWPAFEKGETQSIEVSSVVMWINAHSKNKDLALKYIESLTEDCNVTPVYKYAIESGHTEPVERGSYKTIKQELNSQKEELEKSKSDAEEAEKSAFDEAIDNINIQLKELESTRYVITNEGIEQYASWLPYFKSTANSNYITQNEENDAFFEEVNKLSNMFTNKAIDEEQFVLRLNQVSKLIFAERQSE
jgi:hypothetical protein